MNALAELLQRPPAEQIQQGYAHTAREIAQQPDTCCLLYTSPSPRDGLLSRMPSSA